MSELHQPWYNNMYEALDIKVVIEERRLIVLSMNKEELKKLIEAIPEQDAMEVIDFIGYLKMKRERESFRDLEKASATSTEFWNNPIDDEVWNDV